MSTVYWNKSDGSPAHCIVCGNNSMAKLYFIDGKPKGLFKRTTRRVVCSKLCLATEMARDDRRDLRIVSAGWARFKGHTVHDG